MTCSSFFIDKSVLVPITYTAPQLIFDSAEYYMKLGETALTNSLVKFIIHYNMTLLFHTCLLKF